MATLCRVAGCKGEAQYMGACASCFAKVQQLQKEKEKMAQQAQSIGNPRPGSANPNNVGRAGRYGAPRGNQQDPAKPKFIELKVSYDQPSKKVTQILQKGVVTNTLTEYTSPVRTANHAPIHELYYNPDTGVRSTIIIINCRKTMVQEQEGRIINCEIEELSAEELRPYLQDQA